MLNTKTYNLTVALLCIVGVAFSAAAVAQDVAKVAGWANVPGGKKVWLRPGLDAYEHSTGLVRDLQTGQKYLPITPESITANRYPSVPQPPIVVLQPATPRSPYLLPALPALSTVTPPPYQPYAYQPYYSAGYDYGPNNVYGSQPPCTGNGCGAKLGSPGAINNRWTRVQ